MRIIKRLEKMEQVIISVLFSIMVLAVFLQVVNRNLLKLEISWFEEVARCCMVYVLMFAAEIGLRDHSQINIDSVVRRLPAKMANVFRQVSAVVTIFFSAAVGFSSIQILKTQFTTKAIMPGSGLPTYVPQASVTVGCILIFMTQTIILLHTLAIHKKGGKSA